MAVIFLRLISSINLMEFVETLRHSFLIDPIC